MSYEILLSHNCYLNKQKCNVLSISLRIVLSGGSFMNDEALTFIKDTNNLTEN